MADEIKKMNYKRGQLKAQVTRFSKTLAAIKKDEYDVTEIKSRLATIEPLLKEFQDLNYQSFLLDEDVVETLETEIQSFEEAYFATTALAKNLIAKKMPPADKQSNNAPSKSHIKLPVINIPIFDGKYENWLSFCDTFTSVIHDNSELSDIQKYHYLKSSLTQSAAHVIEALGASSDNYKVAWELLKERYENKRLIVFSHINSLFDLPSVKQSANSLQQLIDQVTLHTKALNALKVDTKHWDLLIIQLLTSKFDYHTRKEWELKATKDLPTLKEITDFINQRCQVLSSLERNKQSQLPAKTFKQSSNSRDTYHNKDKNNTFAHAVTVKPVCYICKQTHYIFQCSQFVNSSVSDRFKLAKKYNLCTNCLKGNHSKSACVSSNCRKCNKRHNTLLHTDQANQSNTNKVEECINEILNEPSTSHQNLANTPTVSNISYHQTTSSTILLSTAVVHIFDKNEKAHPCRVLLDVGSQANFITESLCNKLGLKTKNMSTPISGISQSKLYTSKLVNVKIQSRYNSFKSCIPCLVLPKITENLPQHSIDVKDIKVPSNISLADPHFNISQPVDMLIGAELFWEILCIGQIKIPGNPHFQKTHFGWVLGGVLNTMLNKNTIQCNTAVFDDLQGSLMKFWEIEEISTTNNYTLDENKCEEHFLKTFSRNAEGKFVVKLPFKDNMKPLGVSKELALKRFYSLENKLAKNSTLKEQYSEFMNEYLRLGHMEVVPKDDLDKSKNVFYLPHHAVVKDSSLTTKLRVVFDGSAKTTTNVSLNEILLVGPTLQQDLFDIILRFRTHTYVFTADITKMYRQIYIHPDDRDFQRILWRNDHKEEVQTFRLTTVTYGTASAPYLAVKCLQQVAIDSQSEFPEASRVILRDFYMDDCLTGTNSLQQAMNLQQDLQTILNSAGFPLSKWASNIPDLIPIKSDDSIIINMNNDGETKTLGLLWNTFLDEFKFTFNKGDYKKVSKRAILSTIAKIFDPLGLIAPVVVQAKILIQQLWCLKLSWDESIPIKYFTQWNTLLSDFESINDLSIPRNISNLNNIVSFELHGFCDSSEMAYGCCIYIKTINREGHSTVNLLCAKSRVAPLKQTSLPRLELCGAILLARLASRVKDKIELKFNKCYYWTDSAIVLTWLTSPSRNFKTFVANRVAEIQTLTQPHDWYHVSTYDNPADIISRGASPKVLKTSTLWWHGPTWLSSEASLWPNNPINTNLSNTEAHNKELRKVVSTATVSQNLQFTDIFKKFSSFNTLQKVIAFCFRFIHNCRKTSNKNTGSLTLEELDIAKMFIIKVVQTSAFPVEFANLHENKPINNKSKILSLNPFLDEKSIIRVGGRIKNSNIPFNSKHPIILPSSHHVTNLIIEREHLRQLHAGPQATLAALRQTFWIISGRNATRKIIHKCIKCFRAKPVSVEQLMGNLPNNRVEAFRPFVHCGVDYAGPIMIKERRGRGSRQVKAYIALFICFSTKACHIELVCDLTTEAFLNALRRFMARRGKVSHIYSDNGTNFVGANNELKQLMNSFMSQEFKTKVIDHLLIENIVWHFIPPRSPHIGGLWEAGIKSIKTHLKRTVGNALLTFEEMYTLLSLIESCLNSRPLTPLSNDPHDFNALTPGHFLIGSPLTSIVEPDITTLPENRLSHWQRVQQLHQNFWKRWKREYLAQLQQRGKWRSTLNNIEIGQLIILKDEQLPPLRWVLGRVVATHPGNDGIVRVVTVRTSKGQLKTTINKVCPLPTVN